MSCVRSSRILMLDRDVTDDLMLGGRLRLLQPRRGHRAGHDALLLAAASGARAGEIAVDLGAGAGAAGLALACRVPGLEVVLIDNDPALTELSQESIRRNGFGDRVRAVTLDIRAPAAAWAQAGLPPQCAQRVVMNPPFNDAARHRPSPDPARRRAHVAEAGLAAWIAAARRLLAPGSELVLIWRADGLSEVLAALGPDFGSLAVCPVHPKPDAPAIRVLVRALCGGRAPLRIVPGFVLADADGSPSAAAHAVLRNAAPLPFVDG